MGRQLEKCFIQCDQISLLKRRPTFEKITQNALRLICTEKFNS